ncbi:hypothetical protein [Microbacterium sp. SA39]|uniref:hypothetical protein n=1 Tax=Microbacterium sp. SA39 TaxID=1263625 RepID=UPI0005F9E038|nr:hypothetical protein [Microbacterium sp. SA39]KJQ53238.1 hypothetical protein RS85_02752 [Microbacterium sp. SA39]
MRWSTTVSRLGARVVIRWLALAAWPVHLVFAVVIGSSLILAVALDQPLIVDALLVVAAHYVVGLCASFALHELVHAVVLMKAPGVCAVTLERTALRISVRPLGEVRGRDAFIGAASGPACCVGLGLLLWAIAPNLLLHPWHLLHAVFLTPVFHDGRIMIVSARSWNRVVFRES